MLLTITIVANSQVSKTINLLSAGTLTSLLTAEEKTTITDLTITGIDEAKSAQLNESDKMLIVFIVLEIDTRQIAVLFNTSESSIRGRKTKLRAKLESLNIDIRNLEL